MKVDKVYADISPKSSALDRILEDYKIKADEVCFVGDDLVDLGLLKKVGLPVAVNNALDEIKSICAYVTSKRGGRGAVREVTELLLKTQGKWEQIIAVYDC